MPTRATTRSASAARSARPAGATVQWARSSVFAGVEVLRLAMKGGSPVTSRSHSIVSVAARPSQPAVTPRRAATTARRSRSCPVDDEVEAAHGARVEPVPADDAAQRGGNRRRRVEVGGDGSRTDSAPATIALRSWRPRRVPRRASLEHLLERHVDQRRPPRRGDGPGPGTLATNQSEGAPMRPIRAAAGADSPRDAARGGSSRRRTREHR